MVEYLVDTCIWRDFYEDRISKSGRLLGTEANMFFQKILKNKKDLIPFSEIIVAELLKDYKKEEVFEMLELLELSGKLKRINISKEEHIEAKILSSTRNLPYADCLYAVQARNNKAILITQDKHFFNNLNDICEVRKS